MTSIWGFFYGGLINPEVMDRVGMRPTGREIATLPGHDLRINPLVNLVADLGRAVFGLLLELTHQELDLVYSQLEATYLPYPVSAFTLDGHARAALCYMAPDMRDGQADAEHGLSLLQPAQALQFPEWYLERIRSYLPATRNVKPDSSGSSSIL